MKNAGAWFGILLLAFSGLIFWQSFKLDYYTVFGPGPGLFPLWLSALLLLVSLIYLKDSVKKEIVRFSEILPKGRGLGNVLTTIGSVIVFLLIVSYTGFLIAVFVMLFMIFLREFKWHWALGISVVVSFAVFFIFQKLLGVPLPTNELGW